MKILWPWPHGHLRGGDGADKNFRPISIIMPNMNEIHQRVFKIWGLVNFNAKILTLWREDERMNEGTNVRTTNGKAKTIYPHILCMSGVKWKALCNEEPFSHKLNSTSSGIQTWDHVI